MDQAPLVIDEIIAGKEFVKRLNSYQPVKAAYWLRDAEGGERYLFVALDGLTTENSDVAYREVLRITNEMKDHYIDPFRVKLVNPDERVARAVQDIYHRFPGRKPPSTAGPVLGGTAVADVYIYPPLEPQP